MSCDGFVVGGIWLRFLEGRDCRELFVLFLKEIIGIIICRILYAELLLRFVIASSRAVVCIKIFQNALDIVIFKPHSSFHNIHRTEKLLTVEYQKYIQKYIEPIVPNETFNCLLSMSKTVSHHNHPK